MAKSNAPRNYFHPPLKKQAGVRIAANLGGSGQLQQMENTVGHRIFVPSPAYAGGERARMILNDRAQFALARKLRGKRGAPIADVSTFLSGL